MRKWPFLGVNDYFLGKCSPIVGDDLTTKARRCDILTTKVRMTELTNLQKWPTQNTPKNWSHVNIFRTQLQVLDSFPWKLLFLALLSVFSVHCSKTSTKILPLQKLLQIPQKNLGMGPPPPLFWQCQDFHCSYYWNPSLTHSLTHSVTRSPIELSAGQLKIPSSQKSTCVKQRWMGLSVTEKKCAVRDPY